MIWFRFVVLGVAKCVCVSFFFFFILAYVKQKGIVWYRFPWGTSVGVEISREYSQFLEYFSYKRLTSVSFIDKTKTWIPFVVSKMGTNLLLLWSI